MGNKEETHFCFLISVPAQVWLGWAVPWSFLSNFCLRKTSLPTSNWRIDSGLLRCAVQRKTVLYCSVKSNYFECFTSCAGHSGRKGKLEDGCRGRVGGIGTFTVNFHYLAILLTTSILFRFSHMKRYICLASMSRVIFLYQMLTLPCVWSLYSLVCSYFTAVRIS